MMYFKPATLNDLRAISRTLNIAMVDFVNASMQAYVFSRKQELGTDVPRRKKMRYVGPRVGLDGKRIRYVMKLSKNTIEKVRDIAYLDSRRFTSVCDEALDDFIKFTKEANKFKSTPKSGVMAVRGRKNSQAREKISSILLQYEDAETKGKDSKKSK
jgi:hypothetical protein